MNIINKPSPNYTVGRKNYQPMAIVIHIMEGSLTGTDSWFGKTQSRVSAHYGVGRSGEVHQYVQEINTAWHAGVVASPSWSLIKRTGNGMVINPNYYTVGIEHEGTVDTDWTEAMYDSTSSLIAGISKRWNIPIDRNHVIGHHEIYAVKACPGGKVDFNKLIAMALSKAGLQTPQPIIKSVSPALKVFAKIPLNIRHSPNRMQQPIMTVEPGVTLVYVGLTEQGEKINDNALWYLTSEGHWFWSGGVKQS